jgi:transmembrane sensor
MSSPHISSATAQQIKEQAASWFARNVCEPLPDGERAEFDAWIGQSTAHKLAYWRLDAGWQRSERMAALQHGRAEAVSKARGLWPWVARIGGGFAAALAVAIFGFNYFQGSDAKTFATAVGGHEVLKLADGSIVEMNTDTVLRVAETSSERTVTLDRGEAFFSIKHSATHPFVVIAGPHRIVDLGTQFVVREDEMKLEVILVQGRAQLKTGRQTEPGLVLAPGDVAIATATELSVVRKAPQELNADLGWRRGVLTFDNTPLADVAVEFNRYNRTKLVVADTSAAKIDIGGTFKADDVTAFAEVAKGLLKLQVQKRGDNIVISR